MTSVSCHLQYGNIYNAEISVYTSISFVVLFFVLFRESRENCSLLKEEVEGLRKKLERMEKTKEELVNMELEKKVNCEVTRQDL